LRVHTTKEFITECNKEAGKLYYVASVGSRQQHQQAPKALLVLMNHTIRFDISSKALRWKVGSLGCPQFFMISINANMKTSNVLEILQYLAFSALFSAGVFMTVAAYIAYICF
jgi:hypothetical protein